MKTLEELLELWDADRLDQRSATQLKRLLQSPENRSALAEDWLWKGAISRGLQRQQDMVDVTPVSFVEPGPARPSRNRWETWLHLFRSFTASPAGAVAGGGLAFAAITVALFVLWPQPQTSPETPLSAVTSRPARLPDSSGGSLPDAAAPQPLPKAEPRALLMRPIRAETDATPLLTALEPRITPISPAPAPYPVLYVRLETVASAHPGRLLVQEGNAGVQPDGQTRAQTVPDVGQPIHFGDRISTSYHGRATLDLPGGTQVVLHRQTRLALQMENNEQVLVVDKGTVKVNRQQTVLPPLRIRTQFLDAELPYGQTLLLTDRHVSWIGVGEGYTVTVTRLIDGQTFTVNGNQFAAVSDTWPFQTFPAQTNPLWQAFSFQATGQGFP